MKHATANFAITCDIHYITNYVPTTYLGNKIHITLMCTFDECKNDLQNIAKQLVNVYKNLEFYPTHNYHGLLFVQPNDIDFATDINRMRNSVFRGWERKEISMGKLFSDSNFHILLPNKDIALEYVTCVNKIIPVSIFMKTLHKHCDKTFELFF